jgi:hypothetical protein
MEDYTKHKIIKKNNNHQGKLSLLGSNKKKISDSM